jgi:hypothetical protein
MVVDLFVFFFSLQLKSTILNAARGLSRRAILETIYWIRLFIFGTTKKKGKRKNKENKQNQKSCPTLTTSFTHEQQGI